MLGMRQSSSWVRMSGEVAADCLNPMTYVFQDFSLLPWRYVRELTAEHGNLVRTVWRPADGMETAMANSQQAALGLLGPQAIADAGF